MLQLNFSSFPEIKTNRLLLRRMTKDDATEMLFLRSSEDVMKYIDRQRCETIEDAEAYLKSLDDSINNNTAIIWGITFKENPEKIIGYIGFWRFKLENYRAEVGYMLHPDFWRKGITREALLTVLLFGFLNMQLHSIEANINPANNASAKILESVGFVKEAYFKEDYFFNGAFHDTIIYSLLERNLLK